MNPLASYVYAAIYTARQILEAKAESLSLGALHLLESELRCMLAFVQARITQTTGTDEAQRATRIGRQIRQNWRDQ